MNDKNRLYTVTELTQSLKFSLEKTFPFVWVQGQVSNLSQPTSGHIYFSLKDDKAAIAVVWFKSEQKEEYFDPLTGEVFEQGSRASLVQNLENGQELLCAGRINVYPPRGTYQLIVEVVQDVGFGKLYLEFEALKEKLALLGYFKQERKRLIPACPQRIALITSITGAAIYDFLHIAKNRGVESEIRVYPALVQGKEAPLSITSAFKQIWEQDWAEVVVLIRGGGAIEDLWAFNDEEVAKAIFECSVPVLSGIGHETDTTIADYVADLRAATPSHAAQLLWQERELYIQMVDETENRLKQLMKHNLERNRQKLNYNIKLLLNFSPFRRLREIENIFAYADKLRNLIKYYIEKKEMKLEFLQSALVARNPDLLLVRGYCYIQLQDKSFLKSMSDVEIGDLFRIILNDGQIEAKVLTKKATVQIQ